MIVDFRVRPPFKSFRSSFLYRKRDPSPDPVTAFALHAGMTPYRSFDEQSMEAFIEEMDAAGVGLGVVMGRSAPPPFNGVPNEEVAELVASYPNRLIGFGAVSGMDVAGGVRELDRIKALGLRGVAIDNGYCDPPIYDDDARMDPIYARCEELGLILSITSSLYLGPDLSYSHPQAIQRVARRFPGLKIVVPHACYPWTTLAVAVAMQCTNVYLIPDLYLNTPGLPGQRDYLDAANTYLSHRLLFASSYPVRSMGDSVAAFSALDFRSDAIRQQCLGQNALRLLDL